MFLLGSIYTKRQRQRGVNPVMTLVIQLSLQRMESLQNGLQCDYGATLFVSIDFYESCAPSVNTALTLH